MSEFWCTVSKMYGYSVVCMHCSVKWRQRIIW